MYVKPKLNKTDFDSSETDFVNFDTELPNSPIIPKYS